MKKTLVFIFLIFICFVSSGVFAVGTIDINTASLAQLDTLTGIGPKYAQAIIDARPFSSVDDLLRVSGIGPKTLQKIKDQGLAYVAPQDSLPLTADQVVQPAIKTATEPIIAINEPIKEAPTNSAEIGSPLVYPTGIILNEILPSPEGADETEEWIEIYNQNNFEVDLSGWKIEDTEGTKTIFVFDKNTKIIPNGFLVFKRPETKITLNNSKDSLNILWPDGKIIDSLSYSNAPMGQSYNKKISSFNWSSSLTPGEKNIIAGPDIKNNKQKLSKLEKSDNSNIIEAELAGPEGYPSQNINQEKLKSSNPWFLFFTALIITIISALFVLFIKFKLQKNTNLQKIS